MTIRAWQRLLVPIVAAMLVGCDAIAPTPTPRPLTTPTTATPTPSPYPSLRLPPRTPDPTPTPTLPTPDTRYWTAVGALAQERVDHAAALLADGRVLVSGGAELVADEFDILGVTLESVEIFDPTTRAWTTAAPLLAPREGHTATALLDGRVLLGGGYRRREGTNIADEVGTAEIFDPSTGAWQPVANVPTRHGWETATLLQDGRVLVIGHTSRDFPRDEASSLFDPVTGAWSRVPDTALIRMLHVAVPMADGTVLVAGGARPIDEGEATPERDAALYHPQSNSWTDVGPMDSPGYRMLAGRMSDGRVLAIYEHDAQVFDPPTRAWSPARSLGVRMEAIAPLANGRIAGFLDPDDTTYPIVEVYAPGTATWRALALFMRMSSMTVTPLPDGRVLIAGGDVGCPELGRCATSDTANSWLLDPDGSP